MTIFSPNNFSTSICVLKIQISVEQTIHGLKATKNMICLGEGVSPSLIVFSFTHEPVQS